MQKEKIQPQAIELEEAVLAALMLERDSYMHIVGIIDEKVFYSPKHRLIFSAIKQLDAEESAIDLLTVMEKLKLLGHLDRIGGRVKLATISSNIASAINLRAHALILKQKAIARDVIDFSAKVNSSAYDESVDLTELLSMMNDGASLITKKTLSSKNMMSFEMSCVNLKKDALIKYENRLGGKMTGIPTGFEKLDSITGGWQKSDLIILGGRPAMGKTAVMIAIAKAAARADFKTLMFSIEMSNLQLTQRAIGGECDVSPYKMRTGNLSHQEINAFTGSINENRHLPFSIDDTAGAAIEHIVNTVKAKALRNEVDMVLIDYLQLVTTTTKHQSREQVVSYISSQLKALAKTCNIPIVALSQLNRNLANQDDKRPQLPDIRESGAIEQDADIVMFVHRESYYNKDTDQQGVGELLIRKHRNGATGDFQFSHNSAMTKFW